MADTELLPGADDAVASILHQDTRNTAALLRNNVQFAVDASPDQEALNRHLAAAVGVPLDTVRAEPAAIRAQAALKQFDADKLAIEFPHTAKFLTDLDNARLLHDDVPGTAGVEQAVRSLAAPGPNNPRLAFGRIGGPAFRRQDELKAPEGPAASFGSVIAGLAKALPQGGELVRQGLRQQFADLFGFEDMGSDAARRYAQAQAAVADSTPAFESRTAAGLYSGGTSLLRQIPGLAASILTRNTVPALAAAGGQTEAEAYGKYRARGATPGQAFVGAAGEGTVEVGTEMLPMGFLVDKLGKVGAGEFIKGFVGRELVTEQAATVLQDAIDTAVANPDKTWGQYLAERPDAAYQTLLATLVQSGAISALHTGMAYVDRQAAKVQAAADDAVKIQQLGEAAAASKLRERDPGAFRQFVAAAVEDGPVADVFIDSRTLADALLQSGVPESTLAEKMPEVAAQLANALETNGTVRIPLADYATHLAGGPVDGLILPHLKANPEGFSRSEADAYMQSHAEELKQEVERILTEKAGDNTFKISTEAVRATIKSQLDTAARFTPQVNDAYSSMVGNFYAVTAAKLGTTPEALFQRFPLKIGAERIEGLQFEQGKDGPFGPVLTEFKGNAQGAIAKLMEMGSGEAIGALHHPDIGDIDLVWGEEGTGASDGYGLAKLAKYHPEVMADLQGILSAMAVTTRSKNRVNLESADHRAGVRLTWDSQAKHWLLTAFKKKERGVAGTTTDTADLVAEGDTARLDDASDVIVDQKINEFYQGNTAARGAFNPASLSITLLKNADLSTFLHESGHFFLEVQATIAAELQKEAEVFGLDTMKPGERQILADTAALLQWFGLKDLNEWHALDFEEKRAYHEQFARGFEAYLFEGQAPSIELQGLFQRFRAWLLAVYRELKNLNVELTDQVRGVFDRMLASNEEIALAEQGRSMMPLFTSPEQAGMTPEEFAAYQALGVEATAEAIQDLQARGLRDMQWLHNARGRVIKQLQKEAAAKRAEVEIEVRREVMSQPLYRAWQFLTGKLTAENKVETPKPAKSDPAFLDETIDSLFVAIAKLGGLNKDEAVKTWGTDPADKPTSGVFGKPVWRREGGLSLDGMAEALAQHGYLELDEHGKWDLRELEDKFKAELGGDAQHSTAYDYAGQQPIKPGEQIANPGALTAGRFDLDALAEMGLPAEVANVVKAHKMTAKDGLHPDLVAEMFGFTSGDELVRTLAAADSPKVEIDALTDARMLERYGDLSSVEAIEKAADKAIHNDARARFVAAEANALAKATGQRRVLASAAKEFAAAMVARLKVRDIRPNQYASAEARAAKAAEKASKAGDLATAAAEKRNQLVNNYATRAAYEAQEEVDKGLRYLKKFEGDIKGLDADYGDQIAALLERFDLRKAQTNKAVDKRAALAEWIKAQRDAGLEPDIPPELENEAFRKSYRDLTVEEFRGLVDSVRQIEHLGRLKHKLLTARDQRAYEAVRDEIAAGIAQHAQGRRADTRTPTTNLGRAVHEVKRFWASHIKAATWARVMDGGKDGGPMWEYFVRSANERGDLETTMRAEATARLSEILAPVFKLGRMGGNGQFFPSIGRSLNREARIAIALNTGNAGNLQRLLGGEGWTPAQIAPVLQSLTAAEWQAVQAVWDHFESYRPQIAAKERRIYGKEPEWVAPQAFAMTTADGQVVALRGGYYPIKYDPAASQRAEEHADAESAKRQLQGAYTTATTRRSFTKARAEEVAGRPLLYTLSGLYSGVNDVIHDLAWHEWLIDANRLLRSHTIDTAIRTHYGPEAKQQFKTWVQDIAEGEKGADAAVDLALSRLRQGVSAAGLGFNVMSALIQPLGITQSIVRVGAPWVARGLRKYIAHPLDLTREVNGKSDFMANRARTRFRELNELRNQVQDQTAFRELTGRYAYFLMMRCQQMVDVPTWWGAYEKATAEGNDEDRAVSLADQAVIDAQGGGQTKDLSAIERGGPVQRLFTVFYSFMNTALNAGVTQTMTADTPAKRAKLAADYALLYVVPAVLGYFLKAAITPGDSGDDDWEKVAKKLAANQIDYLMGLMVVVREFADAAKMIAGANDLGRDYTGPAGLRVVADVGKFAVQAHQGEFDDAFRKSAVNVVGGLFGLPSAQINRTWTGIDALVEGKTDNPAAVAFGFQERR